MRVKRFVANSMQEAITRVKADFGKDAVILHTRKIRRGGLWGWLGRTKVEVIAAADGKAGGKPVKAAAVASPVAVKSKGIGPLPPNARPGPAVTESGTAHELIQVRRELEEIRRALAADEQRFPGDSAALGRWRERLIEEEVHPDLVRELLATVRAQANTDQLNEDEWLEKTLRVEIARGIVTADPWQVAESAKVQCLVGPTGVGKTTTIAKLAANYSLLGGKKVALVTADTYRIAAVEQLKTYAEIIGVPLDVVFTPQELKAAIEQRSDYDMILVDTAGRSQKHKMQMQELRAFMDVLKDPQVHLVLSATTKMRDMLDIIERFGQLSIGYLIMTKLDETTAFGSLYNACRLTGKPLSYVTNGQSVPDDIEVADGERIADMILGVRK